MCCGDLKYYMRLWEKEAKERVALENENIVDRFYIGDCVKTNQQFNTQFNRSVTGTVYAIQNSSKGILICIKIKPHGYDKVHESWLVRCD